MPTLAFLDTLPLWLLFLATAALLVAGNALGFRLGSWQRARRADDDKAPTNAIMGSTLGLLAFILAFTFGMSHTRFDTRRTLVLDESSAILRAYQRAQFLPEPQRTECTRLLREYVDLRVNLAGLKDMEAARAAVRRSELIQDELRDQARILAEHPNAVLSIFMQSLSELTDLQMKRVRAAVWNRIPPTIEVMLYVLAFMGLLTMGYNAGLSGTRPMLPTLVLALAFSAIIVLIIDLERPNQTLFEVSQEPMRAVQARMQGD
ncbi:MAG TPA: hypothetical protein PLQ13_14410 [Candidatus Krumholzibacteria bacterium]|nr:hypothetical protein [Candidatus Krumholzibacteria bacterium]